MATKKKAQSDKSTIQQDLIALAKLLNKVQVHGQDWGFNLEPGSSGEPDYIHASDLFGPGFIAGRIIGVDICQPSIEIEVK